MSKEQKLIEQLCWAIFEKNKDSVLKLKTNKEKIDYLIERLVSIPLEISSDEKYQFTIFDMRIILSWNTVDTKLKRLFMVYWLRNWISLAHFQEFYNKLFAKFPISFKDTIGQYFILPRFWTVQNIEKQYTDNWLLKSINFQWNSIFNLKEEFYITLKKYLSENKNSLSFSLFNSFILQTSWIENMEENKTRFLLNTELATLLNIPTPEVWRIFMYAWLEDGSSYERNFSAIHLDTDKNVFYLDYNSDSIDELEYFFWVLSKSTHRILDKFIQQIKTGDVFIYPEKNFQKVLSLISKWLKFLCLSIYFDKIEEENLNLIINLYEKTLFFIEYVKLYYGIWWVSLYTTQNQELKVGLLSFYTEITKENIFETLLKTSIPKETLIKLDNLLNQEMFLELYSYTEKTRKPIIINTMKPIEWWSLSIFKFLIKKIELLQPFKVKWYSSLPKENEDIKNLYFSANFQYFYTYSEDWLLKNVIHLKNRETPGSTIVENKNTNNSSWADKMPNLLNKFLWIFKSQQWELGKSEQNSFENILQEVFKFYPKKFQKREIMKSPYSYLTNYVTPFIPLDNYFSFRTQSFYQILLVNKAISLIKSYLGYIYGMKPRYIVPKSDCFEYSNNLLEHDKNFEDLIKFNNQLNQLNIITQYVWVEEIPFLENEDFEIVKKDREIHFRFKKIHV